MVTRTGRADRGAAARPIGRIRSARSIPASSCTPNEKIRLVTGTPSKKAQGTPPDEKDDVKNYHLFLREPVLVNAGHGRARDARSSWSWPRRCSRPTQGRDRRRGVIDDSIHIEGARTHNLKDVRVRDSARRRSPSSPACRGRASRRSPSTRSMPRGSGATSSRCRRMRGSSWSACSGPTSTR